jgi:hypothetical protein
VRSSLKALETLQTKFLAGTEEIRKSELEALGVNVQEQVLEFKNLRLEKQWIFAYYTISLIDEKKDLDGIPLSEHNRLFNKLLSLWEDGKRTITDEEMRELKIRTPLDPICIRNFELSRFRILTIPYGLYNISLIDRNKDPEGKWTDEASDVQKVVDEIETFGSSAKSLTTERALEAELYKHLKQKFHTVQRQVYIGGAKALQIDIDIGDGKIGVELKLASKIVKSTEKQRLIGQMHDYTTKRYKPENFVLVVAGHRELRDEITLREIRDLVQQRSKFCFLEVASYIRELRAVASRRNDS